MKLVRDGLTLYQEIEVDGETDKVEVDAFDFADFDWDAIADDAQNRLLNLIVKRQNTNVSIEEILECIKIPIVLELNNRRE